VPGRTPSCWARLTPQEQNYLPEAFGKSLRGHCSSIRTRFAEAHYDFGNGGTQAGESWTRPRINFQQGSYRSIPGYIPAEYQVGITCGCRCIRQMAAIPVIAGCPEPAAEPFPMLITNWGKAVVGTREG